MSASSSPFALMPSVPIRIVSAAPVPVIETLSGCAVVSLPVIRSISNSISDVPVPSAVAPGAKPPLARSIRAAWAPSAPATVILSVFVTVAVPHCVPPTAIWPPVARAIVAASFGAVIVTETVPALNVQLTAAPAGAPAKSRRGEEREASGDEAKDVVSDRLCAWKLPLSPL